MKEEYEFLSGVIGKNTIRVAEQTQLNKIYNRVFHQNVQATNCGSCLKDRIVQLEAVYKTYDGTPTV